MSIKEWVQSIWISTGPLNWKIAGLGCNHNISHPLPVLADGMLAAAVVDMATKWKKYFSVMRGQTAYIQSLVHWNQLNQRIILRFNKPGHTTDRSNFTWATHYSSYKNLMKLAQMAYVHDLCLTQWEVWPGYIIPLSNRHIDWWGVNALAHMFLSMDSAVFSHKIAEMCLWPFASHWDDGLPAFSVSWQFILMMAVTLIRIVQHTAGHSPTQ